MNSNQNTNSSLNFQRPNLVFISQPNPVMNQVNGSIPNIFGAPLIPVVNQQNVSATQLIKQVENEVKREKEMLKTFQDSDEVVKTTKKCDLHPHKLSDRCRKCKEIKKDIEKLEEERKVQEDKRFNSSSLSVNGQSQSFHDQNNSLEQTDWKGPDIVHNTNVNPFLKTFKTYGDPLTCNLNTLIHNNILSNQYFKELLTEKGYNETLDEIIMNVKYAEPWTVGTNGMPSTLFCCLYRLMVLQLSEGQVKQLMNNEDSVYLRCTGFLYVRFLCDPKELWNWLSPYLLDEQEFSPLANPKFIMTIGEYVENLLKEYDYYGTRLPRIPVQIERELKMKLMMIPEQRNRKKENLKHLLKFVPDTKCRAVSSQDGEWHNAKILEVVNSKNCRVFFTVGKEIFYEKSDNKWFNHEIFLMKVAEYKSSHPNENVFFAGEEIVDLGKIILLDLKEERDTSSAEKEMKNKRNSSKEKRKKRRSRSKEKRKRKRSSSEDSSRSSRSSSKRKHSKHKNKEVRRDLSPKKMSKKEKEIYEKVIEQERNAAVAKGKDYATRPSSYKSSLSHSLSGRQNRRSKSPELKQKVEIIKRTKSPEKEQKEEKKYSKEYLEMQKRLKEQYGDSSKAVNTSYYSNEGKKKDILAPDVMKLGK